MGLKKGKAEKIILYANGIMSSRVQKEVEQIVNQIEKLAPVPLGLG